MSDKVFYRLLAVICALGALSVTALVVYTVLLYKDCSIISYIANRG